MQLFDLVITDKQDVDLKDLVFNSENERSIKFHEKHGFQIVGRLNDIGEKFNKIFSVIYMQKII